MISKSVPSQLRDDSMVLMQIVTTVSEDDVRRHRSLECLELLFNFGGEGREEAISKLLDRDVELPDVPQNLCSTAARLGGSLFIAAEYDPGDAPGSMRVGEAHHRSATSDLEVIAVSAQAKQVRSALADAIEA